MSKHASVRVELTFPDGRVLTFDAPLFDLPSLEDVESLGPLVLTYKKRNPRTLPRTVTMEQGHEKS